MNKKKLTVDDLLGKYKGQLERGDSETFKFTRIPFNIPPLDDLIGGGVPRKKFSLIIGQSSSGKSFLTSQLIRSVQQNNGVAAVIDTEATYDEWWLQKCGIDTVNLLLSQPSTGEEAFDIVRNLMVDGVDLVILDSLAGLVPSVLNDEDFDYNPIALLARLLNQSLPRLFPYFRNGTALVCVNHTRETIGQPSSMPQIPGGKGQLFFSHLMLDCRRVGWLKEKEKIIGFDIKIVVKKSKQGGVPFGMVTIPFKLDGRIDLTDILIRDAIKENLIEQQRAWYIVTWTGEKIQGMNGLREYFIQRPSEVDVLREKLSFVQGESSVVDDVDLES